MDSEWTTDAAEYLQGSSLFKNNSKVIEAFRGFMWGEVVSIRYHDSKMKYIMDACGLDSHEYDAFCKLCDSWYKSSPYPEPKIPNDAWQTIKLLDLVPPDRREALRCDFADTMVKECARSLEDMCVWDDESASLMHYLNTSSQSLKNKISACIICTEYSKIIPDERDWWMYISRDETVTFIIQGFSDELSPKIVQDDQSLQDFFDFCCRYELTELKDLLGKYLRGDNERFSPPKEDWPDINRYLYPLWLDNNEQHVYWPSITEVRKALRGVCISMQNGIIILKEYPKWLHSITSFDHYDMNKMLFAFLNLRVTHGLDVGTIEPKVQCALESSSKSTIDLCLPPHRLFVSANTGFVHTDVLVFESHKNAMSLKYAIRVCRMIQEHIRLRQLLWDNDESFMVLCHHKSFENHRVNLLFNDDATTRTWAEKMADGLSRSLPQNCSVDSAVKLCDDNVSVQCVDDKIRFFFFSWPEYDPYTRALSYRAKDHIKRILLYCASISLVECRELHKYYKV